MVHALMIVSHVQLVNNWTGMDSADARMDTMKIQLETVYVILQEYCTITSASIPKQFAMRDKSNNGFKLVVDVYASQAI